MKNKVLMFLLVSCSLITMGPMCGGGKTVLEIAGVTPDDGEINVLLDQTVEMTTNLQSIDHTTITNQNFYVRDANGNDVPGTVAGTIPPPDITISMAFTPTNPWAEGAVYTATITTGLKVIVGRENERYSLPEDYSWSFTIRKWFEVGEAVSPAAGAAERPAMMIVDVTPSSATPAVGYFYDNSQENLQFWNGTAWDPSEMDPTGGNSTSSDGAPGFCTDGTNVYLAYSAGETPTIDHDHILAYQWDFANKWRPMDTGSELSLNNQYSARQATMACGSSFAAWVQGDSSSEADDAYVADVSLGASARSGPLSRLGATTYGSDVYNVTATVDGTDVYLAFWEGNGTEETQNRTDLFVSKWDGANFTNVGNFIISDLAGAAEPASLVVSGGNLYLAYTAVTEADGPEMLYVAKHDGADWATMGGAIAAYEGEDHVESNDPDLIMAGDTLYVAWEESDNIFVAYWDAGLSAWVISDQNRVINQHLGSDSSDPSLAYSATEDVLYIALLVNKDYDQVFVMKRNIQ